MLQPTGCPILISLYWPAVKNRPEMQTLLFLFFNSFDISVSIDHLKRSERERSLWILENVIIE